MAAGRTPIAWTRLSLARRTQPCGSGCVEVYGLRPSHFVRGGRLVVTPWILLAFGCSGTAASSPGADGGGSDSGNPGSDASYPDAALCGETPLTFALTLPTWPGGSSLSCPGSPNPNQCGSSTGDLTTWLTITAPDGGLLTIDAPCGDACGGSQCGVGDCICEGLASTSPQRAWDGTVYTARMESSSTCGASPVVCYAPSCAAPGTYTARMCAGPIDADAGLSVGVVCSDGSPTGAICTQVTFEWPPLTSGTVVGATLTAGDGG